MLSKVEQVAEAIEGGKPTSFVQYNHRTQGNCMLGIGKGIANGFANFLRTSTHKHTHKQANKHTSFHLSM